MERDVLHRCGRQPVGRAVTFGDDRRGRRGWRGHRATGTMDAMDGDPGASPGSEIEALGVPVASDAGALGRATASGRSPPREAAPSEAVPSTRELTLEDVRAQYAADERYMAEARRGRGRDLVLDDAGGMREATVSGPVDGAREFTVRDDVAQAVTAASPSGRDLVPDGSGGMRPRGGARYREATLSEAVSGARALDLGDDIAPTAYEGPRPWRDLILDGNGGMRVMGLDGESPDPVPPDLNRKGWAKPSRSSFHHRPLVWAQSVVGSVDPKKGWSQRDGATLCVVNHGKRLLLIGGWDSSEGEHPTWHADGFSTPEAKAAETLLGRALTTNEIWKSDNGGETWEILLEHLTIDPASFPPARFQRVHTPAWTDCDDGYFYLIGGDVLIPHAEVWRTSRGGDGTSWEYMGVIDGPEVHWGKRVFSMAGSIGGVLYVMGGQLTEEAESAQNDMYSWYSLGDRTWKPVPPRPTWEMWSPRGMVYGMPAVSTTSGQKLYLVGGGIYHSDPEVYFDGVYEFDGVDWIQVRPDTADTLPPDPDGWPTGYDGPGTPSRSGRGYHNVVATPPGPGRPGWLLWVITGSVIGNGSCKKILFSRDLGGTWTEALTADWGPQAGSHADGVTVYKGDIIRASGAAADRSTYRIHQITRTAYFKKKRPKVTAVLTFPVWGGARENDPVTLEGEGFSTARAVYVYTGDVNSAYADFTLALPPIDDNELFLTMPKVKGVAVGTQGAQVFIIVVNADGSSDYPEGAIKYLGP